MHFSPSSVLGGFVSGLFAAQLLAGAPPPPFLPPDASPGARRAPSSLSHAAPDAHARAVAAAASPEPVAANKSWYFDLGVNDGASVLHFLETRPERAWSVVLVEANPLLTERLAGLCSGLESSGTAASCLPLLSTALTTFDGPE